MRRREQGLSKRKEYVVVVEYMQIWYDVNTNGSNHKRAKKIGIRFDCESPDEPGMVHLSSAYKFDEDDEIIENSGPDMFFLGSGVSSRREATQEEISKYLKVSNYKNRIMKVINNKYRHEKD